MTGTRGMASARRARADQIRRIWRACGWLGVIATLVISLMPPAPGDDPTHIDKLAHLSGYGLLMFWWAQLVTRRTWKLAVAVVVYGLVIEMLQGLTPERQPDPLDALANAAGVLLGWRLARWVPNLPRRLAALPARSR